MLELIDVSDAELAQIRAKEIARGLTDPLAAFSDQMGGARKRGIEWGMTFSQWWGIWAPYYHLRGHGKNGLVMGRNGDVGPYSAGNVYLTTNLGNLRDYHRSELAAQRKEARRVARDERATGQWKRRNNGRRQVETTQEGHIELVTFT
jgi:hypothetical protein